jgi:hypothetical protein
MYNAQLKIPRLKFCTTYNAHPCITRIYQTRFSHFCNWKNHMMVKCSKPTGRISWKLKLVHTLTNKNPHSSNISPGLISGNRNPAIVPLISRISSNSSLFRTTLFRKKEHNTTFQSWKHSGTHVPEDLIPAPFPGWEHVIRVVRWRGSLAYQLKPRIGI